METNRLGLETRSDLSILGEATKYSPGIPCDLDVLSDRSTDSLDLYPTFRFCTIDLRPPWVAFFFYLKHLHFWGLSDSIVSEPKTCYLTMPIGVVIMHISHEEIHHDFLLYKAENHTIIVVTPALEEGTKTFHPQFANGSNIVIQPSTFIVPVFNYEVKPFTQNTGATSPNINDFPSRSVLSCFALALETRLASSLRKPPKIPGVPQRSQRQNNPPVNDMAGFFYVKFQLKQKNTRVGCFLF